MKWVLLTAPSQKEKWAEQLRELYIEKINHFVGFEIQNMRPGKNAREQKEIKLKSEAESFLAFLRPEDYVILFDEKGKSFSSIEFSKQMEKVLLSGKKRCVFIIGGAFGVSDEIKKRAQLSVSLSGFVFNHLIAEAVVLEQIYRSWTIQKGLPYHNV